MEEPTVTLAFPTLKRTTWIEKNVQLLSKDPRIIEIIYEEGTIPVSLARQHLLNKAKGEYILWIDDDVELHENPLSIFFKHMQDTIAGVAASTIELDTTYYMNETHRRLLPIIYKKMKSSFNCGLYRTKDILEIGGFNTALNAGEDNDVNVRLRKKGKEILGIRNLTVTHHSSRSFEKELGYFQGMKYLYNTYGFFENECSQIHAGKIRTNIVKFGVSPSLFFQEKKKSLLQRIRGKRDALYYLYDNILYWINPEFRKPRNVGLLVTENCFFKCKSCTFWKKKKPETDLAILKQIIDKIATFGIPSITLVGGEPLSRPDIGEIIRYIKQKEIEVTIITNGALGKAKFKELLEIDTISVSTDGMEKTHDELRGVTCWSKNMDLLFELKHKYHKDVNIGFVVQEKNKDDFKPLTSMLKDIGIHAHIMCFNAGGMGQPEIKQDYTSTLKYLLDHKNELILRDEQVEYLQLVYHKLNIEAIKQRCDGPNTKLMIDSKGNIFPCSAWNKPIGNILEVSSFKEVWNSYKPLRQQIINGNHEYCKKCTSCELTNNFIRGKQYCKAVLKRQRQKVGISL